MQDTATPGGLYSTVRLKLGLFGAELLKCTTVQIWTKSAKVGDTRSGGPLEGARRPLYKSFLAPQAEQSL